MDTGKPKIAILRIVALCLTCLLIVLAMNATVEASRHSGDFARWQTDRPVDAEVDFSKTGVTVLPMHETCWNPHSEQVLIMVDGPLDQPTDALTDMTGTMTISYDGRVLRTENLANVGIYEDATPDTKFELANFAPFGRGDYTMTVQIDAPAAALAGHPQHLTTRYFLCGMEQLPELIGNFFALVLWILVLALGMPSVIGVCRHGLHAAPRKA